MKVLYVEDNPADADLTRRHIARHAPHIQMDIADTYANAVTCLDACSPEEPIYDLVLTDVRLPDGDGLRLLTLIRRRKLPIAVAVLTGAGNEEMAVAALKAGADDYLTKHNDYLERLPSTLAITLQRFHAAAIRHTGPLRVLYAEHHTADVDLTRRHMARYAPHIQMDIVHNATQVLQRLINHNNGGNGRAAQTGRGEHGASPGRQAPGPGTDSGAQTAAGSTADDDEHSIDLLLIDYRLPGMNALDLIKELEYHNRLRLPVVLVTGQGDEDVAVQALRLGASDYIVKTPGYLSQLPRVLENTFNQEQLRRERAALRESESRYRTLFERAPVAIYTKDPDGTYTTANQLCIDVFDRDPTGLTDHDLTDASHAGALRTNDREVMTSRQEFLAEERLATSRGERIFLSRKTPLINAENEVTGILGIGLEMTERLRAEEQRRENEQRFRQLAEHIDEVFWLTDAVSGELLYISPAYEQIFGQSCASALADPQSMTEAILPEDRYKAASVRQVVEQGRPVEAEYRIRRPDGAIAWLSGQSFPIFDDQGQIYRVAGLARDITERRRSEEHIHQQERLVTVGRMAAGIAHDFNNILAIIMLYTQMLQLAVQGSTQRRHLDTIYQQALHAANLVQQILDFSRRSTLERMAMDLVPFIKEIMKLWERTLPENIAMHAEFPDESLMISADPSRLQQAIMNIAINARDAMPTGGRLRVSLQSLWLDEEAPRPLPSMESGYWVSISVRDSGEGIPEDILANIFDPFFTTKQPGEGTGLGLAQVYGIVQQLDGHIHVESSMGDGTVFTIYLPGLQNASITREETEAPLPQGTGETILLVEDEEELRAAMQEMLAALGYHVLIAESGRIALELFAQHDAADTIALIVSDLVMPDMGGLALYDALADQAASGTLPPMLLVTGYPLDDTEHKLSEHGVRHWLQKPFTVEMLARRVAEALQE